MPRKAANTVAAKSKKQPKQKVVRRAANGYKLPPPIPKGEVLTDILKKKWRIGESIGVGGFGEIYSATDHIDKKGNELYVIKIEPHANGPLFSEMHFYRRVAKAEDINEWMCQHKMTFLGMPKFIASGSHEFKGDKYRFMVMQRFGADIQKTLDKNGKQLSLKTVYLIALKVIDTLEYIHSKGYVHADIKASNLLTGFGKGCENLVYLVDFGLACKYMINGVHKEYKPNPLKAHDGTIEFACQDAHIGAFSRRGDLESLGLNILQWCCEKLPWENNLKDCDYVMKSKNKYLNNINLLIKDCFKSRKAPAGLKQYFASISKLSFTDCPDYESIRNIIKSSLKTEGFKNDGILEFTHKKSLKRSTRSSSSIDLDSTVENTPPKKIKKSLKMKNSSPDMEFKLSDTSGCSDDVSIANGSVIPTPAMLSVMKSNKQKAEKAAAKSKNKVRKKSNNTKSEPVKTENRTRRTNPRRKVSPRIFSNSFSPEM